MSPYTKKIIRNIEAKGKVVTIFMLMVLVSMTAVFINPNITDVVSAGSGDFDNYIELSTDADQIDSTLTNFPVLVYNSSWVTGLNSTSFSFYDSTGSTELDWELEEYDATSGELVAWVNITSLASTGTDFRLYYDDSTSSDGGENNPTDVWDSDYVAVYHGEMDGSSLLIDSTSNGYDASSAEGSPTENTSATIGYGSDLDGGSSDDGFTLPDIGVSGDNTVVMYIKWDSCPVGGNQVVLDLRDNIVYLPLYYHNSNDIVSCYYDDGNGGGDGPFRTEYYGDNADTTTPHTYMITANENDAVVTWRDGVKVDTDTLGGFDTSSEGNRIGHGPVLGDDENADITVDEIRVSTKIRTDEWLRTVENNLANKTTFVTWGSGGQAIISSSFSISGLTNTRVTWAGTAGESFWCNATGDSYETLEYNYNVNDSDNVTELRVFIDDMNDTLAYINASAVTIYASSDNISFGVPTYNPGNGNGVYTDGGCNITFNSTTWNAGTMGSNPFPIDDKGAGTWTNGTMYFRFKLTPLASVPTDIFWTASITSCKIYAGYYT